MASVDSLTNIDKFIRGLLFKEGKTNDDYMRYLQIACSGIRDLHLHDLHVEATKVVSVDTATNTFPMPDDYAYFTAVATEFYGRWWSFTRDRKIVPLVDDESTAIMSSMPNISDYDSPASLSEGGGKNYYYFDEDLKNRRFIIAGFTPNKVILKYVTNGIDSSGDIYIPDNVYSTLESYIRWQLSEYNNEPISHQERKEKRYMDERRKMRKLNVPTTDEIFDIIYSTTGQGARR